MKKLEDYKGQKIAIRCKTDDEITAILKLNNSVLNPDTLFDYLKTKSDGYKFCYRIGDGYADESFYIEQGYTILPATDFLEDEFIYGQEYEFSLDCTTWLKRIFIAKSPFDKYFITWNENTEIEHKYKYARKINTERNEAVAKVKELVSKFSINQNEVF